MGDRCLLDFPAPLKLLWGQLRMLHSTGSTSVSHSPAAPGFRSAFPCWGCRKYAYTSWCLCFTILDQLIHCCCCSVPKSCLTLWPQGLQHSRLLCPPLCPQSLLKFMSIESVMPSNHFVLCHPLLLLPSTFPSIRVFSSESVLRIRWQKYWSFNISPSNEYSELISFRIDWCDLLSVQGTHKSLLQHHSSKASIPCCTTKEIPTQ